MRFPLVVAAIFLGGFAGASTVIVEDNFNLLGTSDLNGSSPSTNLTGNPLTWKAQATETVTTAPQGNNSGALSVYTSNQSMGLDLGAGYFTTNPGIYRLSVDATLPTGTTSTAWLGIGFAQGYAPSVDSHGLLLNANLTDGNNSGGPWAFLRQNGAYIARQVANSNTGGFTNPVGTYPAGVVYQIAIVLDTTVSQWTYSFFVNGVQVGTQGVYSDSNPNLRYLALSSGFAGANTQVTGTFDNFKFELVPEPSHAILLTLSAGMLTLRRRR